MEGDCELERYTGDPQATFWMRATHLPTGIKVEAADIGGYLGGAGKLRLLAELRAAVSAGHGE